MGYNVLHVIADDAKGLTQMICTQDVTHTIGGEKPLIPTARACDHELARREQQACADWIGQADGDGGELGPIIGAKGQQL